MRSLYHPHPNLTVEEAAQYAWIAGDPIMLEALEASADAEPVMDVMVDNGIDDLAQYVKEHNALEESNAQLNAEIDDLRAKVSALEDALRDAIKFMREPLPVNEVEAMASDLEEAPA